MKKHFFGIALVLGFGCGGSDDAVDVADTAEASDATTSTAYTDAYTADAFTVENLRRCGYNGAPYRFVFTETSGDCGDFSEQIVTIGGAVEAPATNGLGCTFLKRNFNAATCGFVTTDECYLSEPESTDSEPVAYRSMTMAFRPAQSGSVDVLTGTMQVVFRGLVEEYESIDCLGTYSATATRL